MQISPPPVSYLILHPFPMTSPLLALFTRSVREDTRAKSTYWARAGLAAFMLVIMGMAAFARATGGAPGLVFLKSAAWLQTMFLTISGLGYFGSAITEEKEDETLGLLRMTNLSPLSILLGKSTSRLCGALLLLAAQLPFTFMAVTLGGVSPRQVLAAYCTLCAYTFLLCNLALLASVVMPRTVTAAAFTGAVLLGTFTLGGAFVPQLAAGSPFNRLAIIFQTGFDGPIAGFQVIANLAAGVVFFLLAWMFFRVLCETPAEGASASATSRRWLRRGWFAPGRPRAGRALQWKDYHFLHGGTLVTAAKWIGCAALIALTAVTSMQAGGNLSAASLTSTLIAAGTFFLIADVGFIASRICSTEVRDQTLSSLALLPQSLPQIFSAKVDGCWRSLAPWSVLFGLAIVVGFASLIGGSADGAAGGLFFAVIFFGYVFAMSYLGVYLTAYLSLRMKRGALPLAITICLASGVFAIIPLLGWYGVPIAAVVIGHRLRAKTLLRLEDLAAES